jgi:hypothetical protein
MPGCVLHIAGPSFDPDAFLKSCTLQPYKIWHIGEPWNARRPRPDRVCQDSGFACRVSGANGDLRKQLRDAEEFLTKYHTQLLAVATNPTIKQRDLDFGYYCRLGTRSGQSTMFMQGEYLPASFLELAGKLKIGVALSLYFSPESDEIESTY